MIHITYLDYAMTHNAWFWLFPVTKTFGEKYTICLFLERFYCSCFKYWSFSNKVFLKIKSLKKKKKKKKKKFASPLMDSPGVEVNLPTSMILTANCCPVSRWTHRRTSEKGPLGGRNNNLWMALEFGLEGVILPCHSYAWKIGIECWNFILLNTVDMKYYITK